MKMSGGLSSTQGPWASAVAAGSIGNASVNGQTANPIQNSSAAFLGAAGAGGNPTTATATAASNANSNASLNANANANASANANANNAAISRNFNMMGGGPSLGGTGSGFVSGYGAQQSSTNGPMSVLDMSEFPSLGMISDSLRAGSQGQGGSLVGNNSINGPGAAGNHMDSHLGHGSNMQYASFGEGGYNAIFQKGIGPQHQPQLQQTHQLSQQHPSQQQQQEFMVTNEDFPALGGGSRSGQDQNQQQPSAQNSMYGSSMKSVAMLGGMLNSGPGRGGMPSFGNSGTGGGGDSAMNAVMMSNQGRPGAAGAIGHVGNASGPGVARTTSGFPGSMSGGTTANTNPGSMDGSFVHSSSSPPMSTSSAMSGLGSSGQSNANSGGMAGASGAQVGVIGGSISKAKEDFYGMRGLLRVMKPSPENQDIGLLSLGLDLTMLGLNLNSAEPLYASFESPFSDGSASGSTGSGKEGTEGSQHADFRLPACYMITPPPLKPFHFNRIAVETLFFIFYTMPRDLLQLHAAMELYNRQWQYHKELKLWFAQVPTSTGASLMTSNPGSYIYFDVNTWERRPFHDANRALIEGFLTVDEIRAFENPR